MEYNWSIEKIRKQKQETLYALQHKEGLTKNDKDILKNNISILTEMEKSLLPNKMHFSLPKRVKYMDFNRILPQDTYNNYHDIPYYVTETLLNATYCFKDLDDTYDSIELPYLDITNQELVEMSHEFYQWLPDKSFVKEFEKYTDPKKHLLRFVDKNQDDVIFGITRVFYYPKYIPYILIKKENDIYDFLTLNHEGSHVIMYQNDSYQSEISNHYFLTEVEGHFFDFLSIQYLKKYYPEDIIKQLEYDRFTTIFECLSSIFLTDSAIRLFDKNERISLKPIKRRIKELDIPFYVDNIILKENLLEDIRSNICYCLSFLISLDLEEIYEYDPEYAFYIFKKIRNNKTNNIYQNLKDNGISFVGEEENYVPFQKIIKKINELGDRK